MHYSTLLIRREWRDIIRTRVYWGVTLLLMALTAGILALLPWAQSQIAVTRWAVMAPTAQQAQVIRQDLAAQLAQTPVHVQWTSPAQAAIVLTVRTTAHAAVPDNWARVVVQHGPIPSEKFLQTVLQSAVFTIRLAQQPQQLQAWKTLAQPPAIQVQRRRAAHNAPSAGEAAFSVTSVMMLLLILSIYGQMLVSGVAAEKASRMSEVLMVRVRPTALLFSKWIGTGMAAGIQLGAGLGAGILVWALDPQTQALVRHWGLTTAPLTLWLTILAAFVLGYSVYGGLFMMLGASLSRPEEARNAIGLPTFALMGAYGAVLLAVNAPDRAVTHWLTLVPLFFPFMQPINQGLHVATAPEWILGTALTLATGIGLLWWAARRYHQRLLNPPSRR
ncbi:MAG: hypothetical protein C7B46_16995 [Sulfobacillus benefaciens]|uniref:ABC-2 type transporter transmembrane domain-containing protein n=1 Tax=Sulfobacillus benefaciens TaxID=453960 RepID=A0A2T2XA26_9FIRM|nr:MAG: hypothetical protein C7B46_16995 [Sulfobacillus benefaciens]